MVGWVECKGWRRSINQEEDDGGEARGWRMNNEQRIGGWRWEGGGEGRLERGGIMKEYKGGRRGWIRKDAGKRGGGWSRTEE